jgi:hypothetical protein
MQVKLLGLPDDVVSGIDIDRFSSDQLAIVSSQEGGRDANVLNADKLSRRCALGGEIVSFRDLHKSTDAVGTVRCPPIARVALI